MGNIGTKKRGAAIPEQFTQPNGLYAKCEWDEKVVRKLILSRKLAPRFPPCTDASPDLEECPICFMFYPGGLNRSSCCKKPICTECFLQIKKPSALSATCPFCNKVKYNVQFVGPKSLEEREKERQEEQRVAELQQKIRLAELEEDKRRAEERKNGSQPTQEELQRHLQQTILLQQDRVYLQHQQSLSPIAPSPPPPPPPVAGQQRPHRHRRHSHRRHRSSHSNISNHSQHSQERLERQQQRLQQYFGMQPGFPIAPNLQATSWGSLLTRLAVDPSMRHSLVEIEQLMVMEAMRMSLQDANPPAEAADPVAVVGVPVMDSAPAQEDMPAPAPAAVAGECEGPVEASPAPEDPDTSSYTSPLTNSMDVDVADHEAANFQESLSFSLRVTHSDDVQAAPAVDASDENDPHNANESTPMSPGSNASENADEEPVTPVRAAATTAGAELEAEAVAVLEDLTTPVATALPTPQGETPTGGHVMGQVAHEPNEEELVVMEAYEQHHTISTATVQDSFAFL